MASSEQFVQYVCDRLSKAGEITAKKMFGEYGFYCGGKFVGVICDNQLFVKITPQGEKAFPFLPKAAPYPGAKPYFLLQDPDDVSLLCRVVKQTADALPTPKKKPARRTRSQAAQKIV